MNYLYFIIWNDGRTGSSKTSVGRALIRAIGEKDYADFMTNCPIRGYQWSAYITRSPNPSNKLPTVPASLTHECCTINYNGIQLCQVFRALNPKAITYLENRYAKGLKSHLTATRTEFATVAKRISSKAKQAQPIKGNSPRPSRKIRP